VKFSVKNVHFPGNGSVCEYLRLFSSLISSSARNGNVAASRLDAVAVNLRHVVDSSSTSDGVLPLPPSPQRPVLGLGNVSPHTPPSLTVAGMAD